MLVRPIPSDGTMLRTHAKVVHRGRTLAIAHAEVRDSASRITALASRSAMHLTR